MMTLFHRFLRDESGATAIEYGLIAAFISIMILGSIRMIGTRLTDRFEEIANSLQP